VRPDKFSPLHTAAIAEELGSINRELQDQQRPFLLIGFGRWGSSHSSLGIPVDWTQISGARAIVETTLPEMNVELSQGSHFFHNLSSFRASYFMVQHGRNFGIDWEWLNRQPVVRQTEFVRHVRPLERLLMRVDGRTARGVILPRRKTIRAERNGESGRNSIRDHAPRSAGAGQGIELSVPGRRTPGPVSSTS